MFIALYRLQVCVLCVYIQWSCVRLDSCEAIAMVVSSVLPGKALYIELFTCVN